MEIQAEQPKPNIYDFYRACILPPFCVKPCPPEAKCGKCEHFIKINYCLFRLNLKFIDNVIRPTLIVGRYMLDIPIFMTIRELLLHYCSRLVLINDAFEIFPDFQDKALINSAIEKMMAIVQDPILPLEEVVGTMEETILYCESVLKGFDQNYFDETVHAFKTIKIIQGSGIVPTTGLEKEMLDNLHNALQQTSSGEIAFKREKITNLNE
jgi:hypothetical protein